MNYRSTWWLTGAALLLFLFIYFFEQKLPRTGAPPQPAPLLPIAQTEIRALEVQIPGETNRLRAERSASGWQLTNPQYPAGQTAIHQFAETLTQLTALDRLSPHDVLIQGQKPFGFQPDGRKVIVEADTNRFVLHVGNPTPLREQVYVRMEESGEVFVTQNKLLEVFPSSVHAWRSAVAAPLDKLEFDRVQIRSGPRQFEFTFNPTNALWQISKPVPARADQDRITALLQQLEITMVKRFVDEKGTDLERYGLQTPALELSFLNGTNQVYAVQFGATDTNQPGQVFARLLGPGNVVTVDPSITAQLLQPYKNFHDPLLVRLNPAAVDRLIVRAVEDFSVQRQPSGDWMIEPSQMKGDTALIRQFMTNLASLEIVDIAREVPTDEDLASFGFDRPIATYAIAQKLTNSAGLPTNIVATEISFGAVRNDLIYTRRSDEGPVYLLHLSQPFKLPRTAFDLRERSIWNFDPAQVQSISLRSGSGVAQLVRAPGGNWVADQVVNAAIEEIVYRLGKLEAVEWTTQGDQHLPVLGLEPPNQTLEVELKKGDAVEKRSLKFGKFAPTANIYAAVLLPGDQQHSIFQFPGVLYHQLIEALPANK